jgi:hypothetical protein
MGKYAGTRLALPRVDERIFGENGWLFNKLVIRDFRIGIYGRSDFPYDRVRCGCCPLSSSHRGSTPGGCGGVQPLLRIPPLPPGKSFPILSGMHLSARS